MAKNKNKKMKDIKKEEVKDTEKDKIKDTDKELNSDIDVNDEIEEVTNKEQEIKVLDNKDNDDVKVDDEDSKENDEEVIKVLDENNKPISEDIEKEEVKDLGIKKIQKQPQTRNSKLKKAKNGEYYEVISEDMGMWSRIGEVFRLIDLD